LGNQLFQAATAYSLARRLSGQMILDVTRLKLGRARSFALDGFPLGAKIYATPPIGLVTRRLMKMILHKHGRPWSWHGSIFQERSYAFDARIGEQSGDTFLRGYFQSPKYFNAHAAELRAILDPSRQASRKAQEFAETMGEQALAVHVRAGDYASNPKFAAFHGQLSPSYYSAALSRARQERSFDRIFVFSDSPEVARTYFPHAPDCEFVEGFSASDDFFLMSRARGHIIANSTFSWWSAWLDPRPDALVIAPKAWFSPEALKSNDIGDLYPDGWILL
jgi:hypothetical protein